MRSVGGGCGALKVSGPSAPQPRLFTSLNTNQRSLYRCTMTTGETLGEVESGPLTWCSPRLRMSVYPVSSSLHAFAPNPTRVFQDLSSLLIARSAYVSRCGSFGDLGFASPFLASRVSRRGRKRGRFQLRHRPSSTGPAQRVCRAEDQRIRVSAPA